MDLYALPPGEFTAARDTAVKQARRDQDPDAVRALKALRRPSVAAYALNRLVRDEPALLDQLLDLGAALAQAQTGGDADALRRLGTQRRTLVEAVADRAGRLVDGLGPGPRAEVVATLEAAMADPASAEAVRTGRLVRALSYAGFGGADLDDAVAPPPAVDNHRPSPAASAQQPAADTKKGQEPAAGKEGARKEAVRRKEAKKEAERQEAVRREETAQAERAVQQARGELDDVVGNRGRAQRHAEAVARDLEEAERTLSEACETVAAAERSLAAYRSAARAAEQLAEQARGQAAEASDQFDSINRDVSAAQQVADRAQRFLDTLHRP